MKKQKLEKQCGFRRKLAAIKPIILSKLFAWNLFMQKFELWGQKITEFLQFQAKILNVKSIQY